MRIVARQIALSGNLEGRKRRSSGKDPFHRFSEKIIRQRWMILPRTASAVACGHEPALNQAKALKTLRNPDDRR